MYIILNNEKLNIKIAKTFYQRLMGLMGKKSFSYGILFTKCNSIHTFFMKEKIDVVAINRKNEIITIVRNLDKNQIFTVKNKKKNTNIIELPNNISKSLKIGDILTLYK